MKVRTLRQARVGDLLKETLAELLLRKVKDPRVSEVTISDVDISADLRVAHVFFCMRDPALKEPAKEGLASAEGFLRHELIKMIKIRTIPRLTFIYDESFDYGAKIDEILDHLKE